MARVLCVLGGGERGAVLDALRRAGWSMAEVPDIDAALARLRDEGLDVIVLDEAPARAGEDEPRLRLVRGARHERGGAGRREEELRAREERLRAVLDNLPLGLAEVDAHGRFVAVNDRFCRMLDYPRDELLKLTLLEVTAPEDRDRTLDLNGRLLDGALQTSAYEKRYLRRDGTPVWVRVTLSVLHDADGRGLRTLGTVEEIGERIRSDERLRESEERFRQLADAMPQIVWTARADGTVDYYNERVQEFSGFERQADGSWTWQAVLHPEDLQPSLDAWRHALETGQLYEIAHRIRRIDGEYRWYLSRGVPVRDARGRVVRWYGTATDIDAQKKAQDALRDADRRKDEFLGMLSHELRNPLAPIWNGLYLMEHSEPGGERARNAREIVTRQVGHLSRLVDDLLDVTRIARGKVELRQADLDLADLVRRTCHDYRALFEERRVAIGCPTAGGLLWVHGDETRLGQVIGNLLQNAAKFTPAGGRVDIALAAEGPDAVVRVRDTGGGIAPELIEQIFDPFTQGQQTLARTEGGLGLGLALVRGLVGLHGGSVTAASEGPGRGAEFVVRLPRIERGTPAHRAGRPHPPPGTRRRVMVVDDNVDAAESLARLVELLGHEAEVVHSGAEALRRIEAAPPDVVLCDIGLPGMDGFEVAQAIRAAGHATRLVAVSGYAQPEDVRRATDAGFDAHVAKPAPPARIRELLD